MEERPMTLGAQLRRLWAWVWEPGPAATGPVDERAEADDARQW